MDKFGHSVYLDENLCKGCINCIKRCPTQAIRVRDGKAMIISTNLTVDDLSRRYSAQIASRLRGSFVRVAFLGEDIRVKKNWGM